MSEQAIIDPTNQSNHEIIITLVHGTWVKGFFPRWKSRPAEPLWYEENSQTRKSLEKNLVARGLRPRFRHIEWSGGNSLAGRREGAFKVRAHLIDLAKDESSRPHYVIAHSHGGNVALYGIRLTKPSLRPHGLITLATPFLIVNERGMTTTEQLLRTIGGHFLFFGIFVSIFYTVWNLFRWLLPFDGESIEQLYLLLSFLVVVPLINYLLSMIDDRSERIKRKLRQFGIQRPISPTSMCILRAPGDEAALVLNLSTLVETINGWIRHLLGFPVAACRKLYKKWPGKFIKTALIVSLALMFISVATVVLLITINEISSNENDVKLGTNMGNALEFAINIAMYSGAIAGLALHVFIYFLAPLCTILLAILLTISTLTLFAFGFEYPLLAWSFDVHAEPVPEGKERDFFLVKRSSNFLRHGVYDSEEAQEYISDWILANLKATEALSR